MFPRKKQSPGESEFIEQLKRGDEKAVAQWYREYSPMLLAKARQKVSEAKDAEELVQQTFLSCLKALPLFRGNSSLSTWMQSILRHEVADYYRKLYAKKAIRTLPLGDLLLAQPVGDTSKTVVKVQSALSQLTTDYKELLQLKYIDKKKVKDIALELNRTVKAVESDLFRARVEFRREYLKEGLGHPPTPRLRRASRV